MSNITNNIQHSSVQASVPTHITESHSGQNPEHIRKIKNAFNGLHEISAYINYPAFRFNSENLKHKDKLPVTLRAVFSEGAHILGGTERAVINYVNSVTILTNMAESKEGVADDDINHIREIHKSHTPLFFLAHQYAVKDSKEGHPELVNQYSHSVNIHLSLAQEVLLEQIESLSISTREHAMERLAEELPTYLQYVTPGGATADYYSMFSIGTLRLIESSLKDQGHSSSELFSKMMEAKESFEQKKERTTELVKSAHNARSLGRSSRATTASLRLHAIAEERRRNEAQSIKRDLLDLQKKIFIFQNKIDSVNNMDIANILNKVIGAIHNQQVKAPAKDVIIDHKFTEKMEKIFEDTEALIKGKLSDDSSQLAALENLKNRVNKFREDKTQQFEFSDYILTLMAYQDELRSIENDTHALKEDIDKIIKKKKKANKKNQKNAKKTATQAKDNRTENKQKAGTPSNDAVVTTQLTNKVSKLDIKSTSHVASSSTDFLSPKTGASSSAVGLKSFDPEEYKARDVRLIEVGGRFPPISTKLTDDELKQFIESKWKNVTYGSVRESMADHLARHALKGTLIEDYTAQAMSHSGYAKELSTDRNLQPMLKANYTEFYGGYEKDTSRIIYYEKKDQQYIPWISDYPYNEAFWQNNPSEN